MPFNGLDPLEGGDTEGAGGIKTQMGTTLASCSHFVAGELLRLWRQTTVIVAGCFIIFGLLAQGPD